MSSRTSTELLGQFLKRQISAEEFARMCRELSAEQSRSLLEELIQAIVKAEREYAAIASQEKDTLASLRAGAK